MRRANGKLGCEPVVSVCEGTLLIRERDGTWEIVLVTMLTKYVRIPARVDVRSKNVWTSDVVGC
jgi:hypothetical protein